MQWQHCWISVKSGYVEEWHSFKQCTLRYIYSKKVTLRYLMVTPQGAEAVSVHLVSERKVNLNAVIYHVSRFLTQEAEWFSNLFCYGSSSRFTFLRLWENLLLFSRNLLFFGGKRKVQRETEWAREWYTGGVWSARSALLGHPSVGLTVYSIKVNTEHPLDIFTNMLVMTYATFYGEFTGMAKKFVRVFL